MTSIPIRYQIVEVCPGRGRDGESWIWTLLNHAEIPLRWEVGFSDVDAALAAARAAFQPSNTSIRLRVWRDGVWVPEDWWK